MASIAWRARSPETVGLMREWLVAAPSLPLWHDTLAIYAELNNANAPLTLDAYRLMRAAGAMTAERDYMQYYEASNVARAFGEAQWALQQGLDQNKIVQNAAAARSRLELTNTRVADDRTSLAGTRREALAASTPNAAMAMGDAYYGYGDYTAAVEMYRAGLQKGADAGLANIRIGAALAMAGQRAAAETAFRAVTGPRADLAQFWLLWLSTRPAA
jgi:tetratricopeptide (TPR) repeat protein